MKKTTLKMEWKHLEAIIATIQISIVVVSSVHPTEMGSKMLEMYKRSVYKIHSLSKRKWVDYYRAKLMLTMTIAQMVAMSSQPMPKFPKGGKKTGIVKN